MKKLFTIVGILCLFSVAAFAQKGSFAGTWTLDKAKSKLDERMARSIESMTMTVTQTDKELTVSTDTKRAAPPAGAGGGMGGGMGRGGGGMGMGGGKQTYTLDGKEVKTEVENQMGKVPTTTKATLAGGKFELSRSSTFTTPDGEMTSSTKETWELSADGKVLTVNREQTSSRGSNSSTLVFTKP